MANSRHFVGVVALLNSLRVVGHHEPFYVLDAGLEPRQRLRLAGHTEVVDAPLAASPRLMKWAAPLAHPAAVMFLIDTDVIVTRSLEPLVEAALEGSVLAFENDVTHRFHLAWGEFTGLGPLRRETYVNSGFVVLPRDPGLEVLDLVRAGQARVDVERSLLRSGTPDDPFYYPDMDVWNAVFSTRTPPYDLEVLDFRLAPHAPFDGVELVDKQTLRCAYADGTEPFALHHVLRKPWLARTHSSVYSRLLPRLLLAEDVAVRLHPEEIPRRLRPGLAGETARAEASIVATLAAQRGRLGFRRWLASRRAA
ncbi:MAG: hypothetical protein ACR2L0_02945 [Gaiellaceae bacterium]